MPPVWKSNHVSLSSQDPASNRQGKHTLQKENINREEVTCPESPNKQIAKLFPSFNIRVRFSLLCYYSTHLYNSAKMPPGWFCSFLTAHNSSDLPLLFWGLHSRGFVLIYKHSEVLECSAPARGEKSWTSFHCKSWFSKGLSTCSFSQFHGPLGRCSPLPNSHPYRRPIYSEISSTFCTESSLILRPTHFPTHTSLVFKWPGLAGPIERLQGWNQFIHISQFIMPSAPPWTYFWLQWEILNFWRLKGKEVNEHIWSAPPGLVSRTFKHPWYLMTLSTGRLPLPF